MRAILRPRDQVTEIEATEVEKDPDAHKLTTIMAKGQSRRYLWWGLHRPPGRKGSAVAYCYSSGRNAAGFFLGWRAVWAADGTVKEDQWTARRSRTAVRELQKRRTNALKEKGWVRTTVSARARLRNTRQRETLETMQRALEGAAATLQRGHKTELLGSFPTSATFVYADRFSRRFRVTISPLPSD